MTDTDLIDDAELDARLADFGTRWRAAADDTAAVEAVDVPSSPDAPSSRRRRRVPDAALASIAAAAAVVVLVVAFVAIGGGDDTTPAPVTPPSPTATVGPVVKGPTLADRDTLDPLRAPAQFSLGYSDGSPAMTDVTWSAWDDTHATGRGTMVEVPCLKECPVSAPVPATVELDQVSHGRFERAVLTADEGYVFPTGGQRSVTYVYDAHAEIWTLVAQTPGAPLAVYTDGGETLVRPPKIAFGGASGAPFTSRLDWSSWGPDTAVATGTYEQSECTVSCAEGPTFTTQIRLTLDGVKDGRFTRARFEILGPKPAMYGTDFVAKWVTDAENLTARWELPSLG